MRTELIRYHVEGNHITGHCVLTENNGIVYDLLETRQEADEICAVLNLGIGPDWDAVEKYLKSGEGIGVPA